MGTCGQMLQDGKLQEQDECYCRRRWEAGVFGGLPPNTSKVALGDMEEEQRWR